VPLVSYLCAVSPYKPINKELSLLPLYELVTEDYPPHGGTLDEEKIAIIDGSTGMQRTFKDYYTTAANLAGALRYDFGVTDHHTTIALFCPNHVDYAPIVLAVALCGAKVTPINPMYKSMELETILTQSQSTILIAHTSTLDVALQAIQSSGKASKVKHVIVVTDEVETISAKSSEPSSAVPFGTVSLDYLRQHGQAFDATVPEVHGNTQTYPVVIPYSSGTTGLPKGVCLTHCNIVSNLLQVDRVEGSVVEPRHTIISPLPFYHIYAFTVSMLYAAWYGLTLVTMSQRFDLEQFCALVQKHAPERCHLVPPILLRLANDPVVEKYDLTSIQTIVSAAAPLSPDVEKAAITRIGAQCKIKQGWGMSELAPIGTMGTDTDFKPGSVGPLVASTIGKILDPSGKSLPPNQNGELAILGPQVMIGYMDNLEKTKECLSDHGWLLTGDIAHYDNDGHFFITDRIKELIKVRGHQVAPAELEALLLTHPEVVDAAVIGITDEYSGELPRAYIVRRHVPSPASDDDDNSDLKDSKVITESDLYEWVKERVAGYKRLDGGIIFTDAIPKSASGKILRRVLRDQLTAALD
jgi:4-coumarate--CoA ligase